MRSPWPRWTSAESPSVSSVGWTSSRGEPSGSTPIDSGPVSTWTRTTSPGRFARSVAAHDEFGIKAVQSFPAGCVPQVPVSDRRYYPVYQTCIDLDIPMITNAGVPGPRVPMDCQDVRHFDQVCYDFPELRIVMRHGAEPWEDLAVKLMLKWPGLYYMTSAFAPKYYPKAIIDYANTRGADKVMYAGYYPMGISLERTSTRCRMFPSGTTYGPSSSERTPCVSSSWTNKTRSGRRRGGGHRLELP